MIDMLSFLMENDVVIKSSDTNNCMTADEAFVMGGEFVVYDGSKWQRDLYRGLDFEDALKALLNKEEA